ncbi:glycoside hydrolase family 3 C-terminal domain-containing protein [Crossiella cryophila]|uniref:Beta-glucosidase-like glycosyl hydrolase n=1 Tax=Crossiella cryophila TaxID=43355 RepID=A0A7W7CF57_9PSEU|nr:glycoside hydrolase family 3 C-terminal domain-containing protein [Crossiella cryophila]MBB4680097.1 beta-glucosidase-like glycosyl hydrolase [Crossiella cryophila]
MATPCPRHRRLALAATVLCGLPFLVSTAGGAPPAHAAPAVEPPIFRDIRYGFAERAADLVSRLTLAEKVSQLSTNHGPEITRLGVQQYTYWNEGQHGINRLGAATNPPVAPEAVHATSFPTNLAASTSWDPALMHAATTAISAEARGFLDKSLWGVGQNNLGRSAANYGSLTYWAPTVNMHRDPRWGRSDEAFGEDPHLAARMSEAFTNGYQGSNLNGVPESPYLKVAATAKHYALNNVEKDRTGVSSDTTDANLRQYYTEVFRRLIENAGVSGLMTSYNAVNGTPAVANTYTVNQLAQRTYGFGGYVTSDCGAVSTAYRAPVWGHNWAPPGWTTNRADQQARWTNTATGVTVSGQAGGQAHALRAGTNLNCPGEENTLPVIQEAISAGLLSEGVIDNALVKAFTVRMRTGEFDPPERQPYTRIGKQVIESPAHHDLARKLAANSLVLLKNDPVPGLNRPLLPADPSALNRVVVLGDLADKVTLGGYSGTPSLRVSAVAGLTEQIKAANPGASVVFDAAGTSTTATGPAVLSQQTQDQIRAADLVVLFVGTDHQTAGEGKDRDSLALPGNYHSLITQAAALGNPRLALVLQSGGPVRIEDLRDRTPAVVYSSFNGESQGAALADVLLGKHNPSGRLSFTWYRDEGQLPAMSNYGLTPAETGGLGRTYQHFTGTPSYPFGFGLSYSDFSYSAATIDRDAVTADGTVSVSFTVTNTGRVPGATVAQLYLSSPVKKLVGFQKTAVLQPGAAQRISLPVAIADLAYWDAQRMRSVVREGAYVFQLGRHAGDAAATVRTTVRGAITPKVRHVTVQPEAVLYNAGETLDLTGKNRWIKDNTNPARENRNLAVTADNVVEAVHNDQSFVDIKTAQVRYASSNEAVATVSPAGLVRAVSDGAATISVTVNGVTGTAPILVRNSLRLTVPPITLPGGKAKAATSFVNGGDRAISGLALTVSTPNGWTARATTPSTFPTVPGGQTVRTEWELTPPAGAIPASHDFAAQASAGGRTWSATGQTSIPHASLAAALNNPGVSEDANPATGNLDGGGLSYSAQTLAAAGIRPGGQVDRGGIGFRWPSATPGQPDNAVASGQSVLISGTGNRIGVIGSSTYGATSGAGTIVYTDGTVQSFALAFNDWWSAEGRPGSEIVATFPYLNSSGGSQPNRVSLFYSVLPLQPGRTVQAVILPKVSATAVSGVPAMHVFAIGIG